jgi:hypothetical protein
LNDVATNSSDITTETNTLGKTACDIGTITTASTSSATLMKTGYTPESGGGGNAQLELTLSGLPEGYDNVTPVVTATTGANGNEGNANSVQVSAVNSGEATITIRNLTDGNKLIVTGITVNGLSLAHLVNSTFNLIAGPEAAVATSNSTSSTSGVTTNAVTLTWTKPTKAQISGGNLVDSVVAKYSKTDTSTDYKITISDDVHQDKVYYSQNKLTLTLTDLDPGTDYSYKVENKLTPKDSSNTLVKDSTTNYVVVTSGVFETAAPTLADVMAVGRPTDIKTAATDSSVKITWKAPLNYTGAYNVAVKNLTTPNSGTFTVVAGAKPELTIQYGTEDLNNIDLTKRYLKSGDRYEVVITPTSGNDSGTNGLASTPTNFVALKAQSDSTPTVPAKAVPDNEPAGGLITITAGNKPGTVKVGLASSQTIDSDVEGFWIKLDSSSAPTATAASNPATDGFVYVTKAQVTAGVEIIATGLTNVAARIHAANSGGYESTGTAFTSAVAPAGVTSVNGSNPDSAKDVTGTVTGNKVTVTWKNNNAVIGNSISGTDDYYAVKYDVFVSDALAGPWVWVGEKTGLTDTTADSALTLDVPNLQYGKDYYFAVVATCNDATPTGEKVAALKASAKVTTGTAPTIDAKNILTAKKVKDVKLVANAVTFGLDAFVSAKGKTDPEQYYVVLRDANKAVIAQDVVSLGTTATLTLPSGVALTPKGKYTVEVYGVVGSGNDAKVSTAKASASLTVADYPPATLKVTSKASVNGFSITVTDKTVAADKFYYVQYTKVADAKSKPDWSTATVEKLAANNVSSTGGTAYPLGTKLDPNTQYYARIVTADTNVAITLSSTSTWTTGSPGGLDDWSEATKVVFGKEIKVKTAAVPLATTGKPSLNLDTDYNITLKTTGQTMLSIKDADKSFGASAPLNGATFEYKLLVSPDSKVDKVTGKLLGSAEINLTKGIDIKIESYVPKSGSTVADGQYTLEYALTGVNGIIQKLGIAPNNISTLKNLNFQLVTTVTYGGGESFDSVTKVGKVTMPKWFV